MKRGTIVTLKLPENSSFYYSFIIRAIKSPCFKTISVVARVITKKLGDYKKLGYYGLSFTLTVKIPALKGLRKIEANSN